MRNKENTPARSDACLTARPVLLTQIIALQTALTALQNAKTSRTFEAWTSGPLMRLLPHRAVLAGFTYPVSCNGYVTELIPIGLPASYLRAIRNETNQLRSSILEHWHEQKAPFIFDTEATGPYDDPDKRRLFRVHGLTNIAVHGYHDTERRTLSC